MPGIAISSGPSWDFNSALIEFFRGQLRLKDLIGDEFDDTQANMVPGGDGAKGGNWNLLNSAYADIVDINTTVPGALYFKLNNLSSTFRNNIFTAPFLYKEFDVGEDFDISFPSNLDGATRTFEAIGFFVRSPDTGGGQNWIGIATTPSVTQINADTTVNDVTTSITINSRIDGFFRIKKVGDIYTLYGRTNEYTAWIQMAQYTRADFTGTLQVGIAFRTLNTDNLFEGSVAYFRDTTPYTDTSPVATSPWIAIDQNTLDAVTAILLQLILEGTATIKFQWALNNGAFNGTFLTPAQLLAALVGQSITNHTNSLRLMAQFNSDTTDQAAMLVPQTKAEVDAIVSGDFPAETDVRLGVDYDNAVLTGSLIVPAVGDVREGVGVDATVGTYEPADEADVLLDVQYGADGTEFTGSLLRYAVPTDASDTLRQRIMDTIETRMGTILVSNGFKTNVGQNVFPWSELGINNTKLPALIIRDVDDDPDQEVIRIVDNILTVQVIALTTKSATSEQEVREIIADVIKAVGVDETWGDLAEFTLLPPAGMEALQLEKKLFGSQIDLVVEYTTGRFDPFGR